MKDVLLHQTPVVSPYFSDWEASPVLLPRRRFLQTTAGGLGALTLMDAMPTRAYANPFAPFLWEVAADVLAGTVLYLVQKLIDGVLGTEQARAVTGAKPKTEPMPLDEANPFHGQFAPSYDLVGEITSTKSVHYDYYLEVNLVTRSDSIPKVREFKDLNYFEMRRLTHKNVTGSNLIFNACGYRVPPDAVPGRNERDVRDAFTRVCKGYRIRPEECELRYCRPFRNSETDKTDFAYFIESRSNPKRKDLLLDDDNAV